MVLRREEHVRLRSARRVSRARPLVYMIDDGRIEDLTKSRSNDRIELIIGERIIPSRRNKRDDALGTRVAFDGHRICRCRSGFGFLLCRYGWELETDPSDAPLISHGSHFATLVC